MLTIIEAARRRKKIFVERENKPPLTVTLLAVETDFLCSRQYLVALNRKELMRLRIEKITADELPCRIVDESAGEFICVVETPDPLLIYPRLWKFQPWAEILAGADGLLDRMRRDTLEALKNYAEPV